MPELEVMDGPLVVDSNERSVRRKLRVVYAHRVIYSILVIVALFLAFVNRSVSVLGVTPIYLLLLLGAVLYILGGNFIGFDLRVRDLRLYRSTDSVDWYEIVWRTTWVTIFSVVALAMALRISPTTPSAFVTVNGQPLARCMFGIKGFTHDIRILPLRGMIDRNEVVPGRAVERRSVHTVTDYLLIVEDERKAADFLGRTKNPADKNRELVEQIEFGTLEEAAAAASELAERGLRIKN